MEISGPTSNAHTEVAHIGKSVVIRGELSGSEDLYVDGEVEGSIELREHHLTIGPNGKVRANLNAREVVVHGELNGNVHGTDRVELKKSALLTGDILTQRIVIEDGAVFKGSIETQQQPAKVEPKRETVASIAAAAFSGKSADSLPVHAGAGRAVESDAQHAALVEQKK